MVATIYLNPDIFGWRPSQSQWSPLVFYATIKLEIISSLFCRKEVGSYVSTPKNRGASQSDNDFERYISSGAREWLQTACLFVWQNEDEQHQGVSRR